METIQDTKSTAPDIQALKGLGMPPVPQGNRSRLYLLALFLLLMVMIVGAILYQQQQKALHKLQKENGFLRAKLELYSSTVDSIFTMLDLLEIKSKESRDFPYNTGNYVSLEPEFSQKLKDTDLKLALVLSTLASQMEQRPVYQSFIQPGAIENIPAIYPSFGRISDYWGTRIHPITGRPEFHYGVDIANQAGTPIYATAAGIVKRIDYDTGYGKRITLDHGNGFCTLYAHLYNFQVREGERVSKGQIIALMGNTGISTGPHLHYEVIYNDTKINPVNYLNRLDNYAFRN